MHLTERFNGKDVYLIGTANSSTMLAQRTQKLIEEIKPDRVLVQTSQDWWENARMLKFVDSQAEMDKYGSDLDKHSNMSSFDYYYSNRKWLGLMRLFIYYERFRSHFGMTAEF